MINQASNKIDMSWYFDQKRLIFSLKLRSRYFHSKRVAFVKPLWLWLVSYDFDQTVWKFFRLAAFLQSLFSWHTQVDIAKCTIKSKLYLLLCWWSVKRNPNRDVSRRKAVQTFLQLVCISEILHASLALIAQHKFTLAWFTQR